MQNPTPSRQKPTHPRDSRHVGLGVLRLPSVAAHERRHGDAHLVLWQHLGTSTVHLRDLRVPLTRDRVCWVPAGARHRVDVGPDSVLLPVLIRHELSGEHLRSGSVHRVDEEFRNLLLALLQQQNTVLRTETDLQRRVLQRLLRTATATGAPPLPRSPEAREIAALLVADPGRGSRLTELCGGVCQRTIERQFRAETGLTPGQWRVHNRLAAALEVLCCGEPVAAAALRAGYRDLSAFRRAFKTRYGVPPGRFPELA